METIRGFRVKLVFSRTLYSQSAASVTMGSLAAYLRQSGFQVDLCLLGTQSLHDPEVIVGDSLQRNVLIAKPNFKDYRTMLPLLERLKLGNIVQRIFLCGPFARLNDLSLLASCGWIDGVIKDQPEASSARLLKSLSPDLTSWQLSSPGTISRDPMTGKIGQYVPLCDPVPLSSLPFPSRDIEAEEPVAYVNLEASRGCMFNCSFCHIPLMHELGAPRVDIREPELVVDEIEHLNKKLGKTLFIFNDSCFWSTQADDDRILRFCHEITKRKLDVRLYVYLKGEPFIGNEVIKRLVEAGLVRIFLGIENAVATSLALYRKRVRPDLYSEVKRRLDPLGVNIHIGYIAIEPHSSLDDVSANIEYLFKIGKLFRLGTILEPVRVIPGSSLYHNLIRDGLIRDDLSYEELTYGYHFRYPEVGTLLAKWKKTLEGPLREAVYGFEYYSTAGELLRVLAERIDPRFKQLLAEHYSVFNAKKDQGMSSILGYFRATIESAKAGQADPPLALHHLAAFERLSGELAIRYAAIAACLKQNGGQMAVKQVYVG